MFLEVTTILYMVVYNPRGKEKKKGLHCTNKYQSFQNM